MNNHKVKYFIIVIAILAVILILSKIYSLPEDYWTIHDYSDISIIQIVAIGEDFDENGEIEQKVLATIEKKEDFISDFKSLYCNEKIPGSPPHGVSLGDVVIKFIYNNGDYELVASSKQSRYKEGDFQLNKGFFNFNKDEFEELISKYLPESE